MGAGVAGRVVAAAGVVDDAPPIAAPTASAEAIIAPAKSPATSAGSRAPVRIVVDLGVGDLVERLADPHRVGPVLDRDEDQRVVAAERARVAPWPR